ncbi:UNVERIFIED_CONTAM: hypothetical protein GTU68_045546, partial [Idotea baltica]|nr:hypothetical protein [Idotea baltica]
KCDRPTLSCPRNRVWKTSPPLHPRPPGRAPHLSDPRKRNRAGEYHLHYHHHRGHRSRSDQIPGPRRHGEIPTSHQRRPDAAQGSSRRPHDPHRRSGPPHPGLPHRHHRLSPPRS